MNTINIGGDPNDPFYRYKMPTINTIIQKKSGGTTVITNAGDIATALARELPNLAKYMSGQLRCSVRVKGKTIVIPGQVSSEILQGAINDYITAFVLCKVCGNPETVIKRGQQGCKSCGEITNLM